MRIRNVGATIVEILYRTFAVMLGMPVPFDKKIQALKHSCQQQHQTWMVRIGRREYFRALRRKKIRYMDCQLLLESFVEWNAKTDREEGVLPGNIEEAEAFLRVEVEEPSERDREANLQIKAFMELTDCVEGSLTFSVGDRVFVKTDLAVERTPFSGTAPMKSSDIMPAKSDGRKGSVVAAFPCNNIVLFDETFSPELVSASSCQLLNAYDELEDENNNEVDRLEASSILNEEVSTTESNNNDNEGDEVEEGDHDADDHECKEEKEEPPAGDSCRKGKRKARTVEEALEEGGWKLIKSKKHILYRRVIQSSTGNHQKQHFTMAKTPSDHRASRNALSTLNRLNKSNAPPPPSPRASDGNVHLCSVCVSHKPKSSFSKKQIKKGTLKCKRNASLKRFIWRTTK